MISTSNHQSPLIQAVCNIETCVRKQYFNDGTSAAASASAATRRRDSCPRASHWLNTAGKEPHGEDGGSACTVAAATRAARLEPSSVAAAASSRLCAFFSFFQQIKFSGRASSHHKALNSKVRRV